MSGFKTKEFAFLKHRFEIAALAKAVKDVPKDNLFIHRDHCP